VAQDVAEAATWHSEDVLDVYERPYHPQSPQVCLDETSKPLIGELREALPKHGSWLNMAETELSALSRQCLDRRPADKATLAAEVAAWEKSRNAAQATIDWRFTAADARIKLRRLYPVQL
jgi:hypothetical protein